MRKNEAVKLVEQTFSKSFSEESFHNFIRNLLNGIQPPSTKTVPNAQIPQGFREHVHSYTRLGTYQDPQGYVLDVVLVKLKNTHSLDRARTRQRNLMAHYLKSREKDGVLVAYVTEDPADWRFSYVKLAYQTDITEQGKVKVKTEFTPASRFSFLVGKNEPNHTAQQQLVPLLMDEDRLTIEQIEETFNIESVTKEFFEQYKSLFLKIKENLDQIVKDNGKVKEEFECCKIDTGNFAKKLLGQVVFLYFLQKKGWLGVEKDADWGTGKKNFLFRIYKDRGDKNYFDDILEPFFYEALAIERKWDYYPALQCKVPFLNGGLFEPLNGYNWENTQITLDNQVFEKIFKVFNLYNFTVREDEPLEKEVAVDPEMLGKVFENLLEITDRKSKGTYYTPREIVHYMCQESLINHLDTSLNSETQKIPKGDIEYLIRKGDASLENDLAKNAGRKSGDFGLPESIREYAKEIDFALADVKICDPAIGSGAFPVGMMTEIVRVRQVLTLHVPIKRNRDAYNFKWHCIENSLYGVDIDPSAVEIAKLRLWLSLVVDEESYDHIRPLPNLDYRIICGNSLLSVQKDLFNYTLYPELEKKKIQYFGTTSPRNKEVLRREINNLIDQLTDGKKGFDYEVYFSEVFSSKHGFDVVIGNPPYVRQELISSHKQALKKEFPEVYQGTADLYVYFYARGLGILRPKGVLTFITSNKFMRTSYGMKLRQYLSKKNSLQAVIDFGDLPVFDATAYPCIVIVTKHFPLNGQAVRTVNVKTLRSLAQLDNIMENQAWWINQTFLQEEGWILQPPQALALMKKLSENGIPLKNYVKGKIFRGIVTGYNKAFVIDGKTRAQLIDEDPKNAEIIKPLLRGRDIQRWKYQIEDLWLIFTRRGINIGDYPMIEKYLRQFYEKLHPRSGKITTGRKPGSYQWYEIQDNTAYYQEFEKPKVVWPNLCLFPKFVYETSKYYICAPANILPLEKNQKYVVGILNSKVISWYIKQISAERSGGYLEYKPVYVSRVLVPENYPYIKNEIQTRVSILSANDLKIAEVNKIEAEIDQLVYELYDLTEEEIAIIEESVGR